MSNILQKTDKKAVWLIQGWLFVDNGFWNEPQMKALLTSVPLGRMLVLDLDSTNREQYSRSKSYFGQPFIFNMLHDFGGQMALFGRKNVINSRPFEARAIEGSTMVGTGFTMEGIHNSYIMYDLMSEISWRTKPIEDLDAWFEVLILLCF